MGETEETERITTTSRIRNVATAIGTRLPSADLLISLVALSVSIYTCRWTESTHSLDREIAAQQHLDDAIDQLFGAPGRVTIMQRERSCAYRDDERLQLGKRDIERALKLSPMNPRAHAMKGLYFSLSGDPQSAREAYSRAVEIDPHHIDSRCGLAQLDMNENPRSAEQALRQVLRDEPAHPCASSNLAIVLADQGRIEEAAQVLADAIARHPEMPLLHLNLANFQIRAGLLDDAVTTAKRGAALAKNSFDARYILARTLLRARRLDEAESLAQALYEGSGADLYADAASLYSSVLIQTGAIPEAVRIARDAAASSPVCAQASLTLGMALSASGDVSGAELAIRRAAALDPSNDEADRQLGLLHLGACRYDDAEAAFDAALNKNSESAAAHEGLALSIILRGQEELCVPARQLGRVESFNSDPDELAVALEHLSMAELIDRSVSSFLVNRGLVLRILGRFGEAGVALEKALALDPDSVDARSMYGLTLASLGRYDEAIAQLEIALDRSRAEQAPGLRAAIESVQSLRDRALLPVPAPAH